MRHELAQGYDFRRRRRFYRRLAVGGEQRRVQRGKGSSGFHGRVVFRLLHGADAQHQRGSTCALEFREILGRHLGWHVPQSLWTNSRIKAAVTRFVISESLTNEYAGSERF